MARGRPGLINGKAGLIGLEVLGELFGLSSILPKLAVLDLRGTIRGGRRIDLINSGIMK